jgi:adenylate cyclase
MAIEIERKYLTISDAWRENAKGVLYVQGYLDEARSVRVNLMGDYGLITIKGAKNFEYKIPVEDARSIIGLPEKAVRARLAGEQGYLTIKGKVTGISRSEFEYEIPAADAAAMQSTICRGSLIEKTRYKVPFDGLTWEVDEFAGDNKGLIVAEVELPAVDTRISLPPWIGAEVTTDKRYYNAALSKTPYSKWKTQDAKQCHSKP